MGTSEPELRSRLRARLGEFCEWLRALGVPVGVGADIELARATESLSLLRRSEFREAAVATLAKSREECAMVHEAFDAFFLGPEPSGPRPTPGREVASLRPDRRPSIPPIRTPGTRRDPAPAVARIPVGTYSLSAPAAGHDLGPVTDRQLRAIRRGVRRFRHDHATRPGRRTSHARAGEVDLRDTIRQGLRAGGEWTELRRRRPGRTRARFVVLWDVSGSMREHEGRLFGLVHALESSSRTARVFAFSTRLVEITDLLRREGYRRAARAAESAIAGADGGTQIGTALSEFSRRFSALVTPETTLVIVSDGWDLGDVAEVGTELSRLRRRAHAIVWVAPYTRHAGFEPRVGALATALPYIDELLGPEDFENRWPLRPFATGVRPAGG